MALLLTTSLSDQLAIAVILATLPEAEQEALLKLPFLYAMTALCVGSLVTWTYRRFPST